MLVIVVSPDPDEREHLAYILRRMGLTVNLKPRFKTSIDQWLERPAELIILTRDDAEGLCENVKEVRAVTDAPLLLLAETPTDRQICEMLELGADLVLSKPISPKVISAYSRTLLKRRGGIPAFVLPTLDFDGVKLNPSTRAAYHPDGASVNLTQLEFRLLYVLMTNRGQVIPTETIVERVWGYAGSGSRDLVRGLVSRLRAKLEHDPRNPQLIHTVPGVGYLFNSESH
jgi:DNA-binding response OmpR family regulator